MWDGFRGNSSEWGFEAPVLFKRNGVYYALFGPMCCFCYQGSGIRVYTAPHPLGPYTYQGGDDIACYKNDTSGSSLFERLDDPEPTPGQGCLFYADNLLSSTRAQQNYVVEVGWIAGSGVPHSTSGLTVLCAPDPAGPADRRLGGVHLDGR
jgi:hypothetical protein